MKTFKLIHSIVLSIAMSMPLLSASEVIEKKAPQLDQKKFTHIFNMRSPYDPKNLKPLVKKLTKDVNENTSQLIEVKVNAPPPEGGGFKLVV